MNMSIWFFHGYYGGTHKDKNRQNLITIDSGVNDLARKHANDTRSDSLSLVLRGVRMLQELKPNISSDGSFASKLNGSRGEEKEAVKLIITGIRRILESANNTNLPILVRATISKTIDDVNKSDTEKLIYCVNLLSQVSRKTTKSSVLSSSSSPRDSNVILSNDIPTQVDEESKVELISTFLDDYDEASPSVVFFIHNKVKSLIEYFSPKVSLPTILSTAVEKFSQNDAGSFSSFLINKSKNLYKFSQENANDYVKGFLDYLITNINKSLG